MSGTSARVALLLDVIGDRRGMPGNVRLLLELAKGLGALGHRVTIVCHDHDPDGFDGLDDAVGEIEIRAVHVGDHTQRPRGQAELLRRYWVQMRQMAELVPPDTDVVNAHDWPSLRAGALASRRLRIPLIWTRNDDAPWERAAIPGRTVRGEVNLPRRLARGMVGLLDLRDARRAHDVVVLSEFDAGMVRSAYRRPATVLRIGYAAHFADPPDRTAARAALGLSADDFLVAAVALLVPYRRFEDLIDAVAALGDDPAVRCLLVGSDHHAPEYADGLAARIASLGLTSRVELRRQAIPEDELRGLYAATDMYVFPSSRQSYGQAPLEALAAGTPVIVSSGAGVHEILAGRPGVDVVEPNRPDEIAAAIRAARGAPRGRAEPTRLWLRQHLTNERYAAEMAALIDRARIRRAHVRA